MSKWTMLPLSEIFELQMGKTPDRSNPEYWNNGQYKWISIADLSRAQKYIGSTKESISETAVCGSGIKVVPSNTVVMSFKLSIGKTAITTEPMYTNEAIMAFHDRKIYPIDINYIYYLFSWWNWNVGTNKAVMGTTLNKATLQNIAIPLPTIGIQREIAATLDAVSEVLRLRKAQLAELDNLVKSKFVKMFGDLALGEKYCLKDVADIVSGITLGRKTANLALTNIAYMRVANVKDGYIDLAEIKMIEATADEINRYLLKDEDILLTEGGDPDKLGRGAIWTSPINYCIHQNHIFRVRLNKSIIVPVYFVQYLKHRAAKEYFLACAKQTTGIASINMTQLKALPIPAPPLPLQTRFADFVHHVDQQKQSIQQSLDESQRLFDSLMAEYFED